ncbi:rhamnan synthesis F family protein [Lapillicoccus jejuensis]|uniref:Rhamnosyltransferase n=1 Tax=Lapillicoccus jejuensis TaxID=402171 RepID=A0A542DVW8_9MICO|nr:rhamnan synthesis F family protein [Lapillicoccus jejuensis]TQJ07252.1 rhamnosyltransferase [Lapillicoccus jejuensis]
MRRIAIYLFHDRVGRVDDYVPYKLRSLRPFVEEIFVVSNGPLTPEGRATLEEVADTVWARENVGFDVWGYKEALELIGPEHLATFDELILLNYTFFGPIHPWGPVLERMDREQVDFWGLTAHGEVDPNPHPGQDGPLPEHLQSHWLAVRRPMFTSLEWQQYWSTMPMITSYEQSVLLHEARFTAHFAAKGFRWTTAFPTEDYPSIHPIFDNTVLMLEDGCPIIKRRLFFHDPWYLEQMAIIGRRVMEHVETTGYPPALIWRNIVRSAEPRSLYTNMSLLSVLPDGPEGRAPQGLRICLVAHVFYEDLLPEMVTRMEMVPGDPDVVITTDTDAKRERFLEVLGDRPGWEVRVLESNRGRETSAFLVGCRDLLEPGRYDLVGKLHSKKSAQDGFMPGQLFKHHMFDNLLSSPGYVGALLDLFAQDETLGMVFPPVVNISYPTIGHSWFTNRENARALADELGIAAPFDASTPVAPYGGMFWCRPQALAPLLRRDWRYEDFPDESGWGDGGLAHVIERLYAYSAAEAGFHTRMVLNHDWAEINYAFLEYKLQLVASRLPARPLEQMNYLTNVTTEGPLLLHLKNEVDRRYPRLGRGARPAYRIARGAARAARTLRSGR